MNYYLKVLQQYADFSGRARRSEYWFYTLFNTIAIYLTFFIGALIHFPFLGAIYFLGILIPTLAVIVRRMHDCDKSGWFYLIPIYNIILLFSEGTRGPNNYGPDPKDPNAMAGFGGDSNLLDDNI
jgi:uncharacterized membrane protein YhaH (DUF805 family)